MVALPAVSSSNRLIASTFSSGLVAVFVGATSGIGYYTLKEFAKQTSGTKARVYFVGRSKEAGDRISAECAKLNPDGEFTFLQCDVSLMTKVDEVCKVIKENIETLNLLVLSAGTLAMNIETSEGLDLNMAVGYYGRTRFIANLLPLLQRASSSLSRVVTVLAGTKEGKLYPDDMAGKKVPLVSARGHVTSLTTLTLAHFSSQAPGVSFIHSYPGPVKTGIGRDMKGAMMSMLKYVFMALGPFIYIPEEESGARHVYLCTSGMFGKDGIPAASGAGAGDGKAVLAKGVMDGVEGSGVYCTTSKCDAADAKVVKLMEKMKRDGLVEKVWEHTSGEFKRITGTESL